MTSQPASAANLMRKLCAEAAAERAHLVTVDEIREWASTDGTVADLDAPEIP